MRSWAVARRSWPTRWHGTRARNSAGLADLERQAACSHSDALLAAEFGRSPRWTCQPTRPDAILLLPLYPQFSTTAAASSFRAWQRGEIGLALQTRAVCCWPDEAGFIGAMAEALASAHAEAAARPVLLGRTRLQRVVKAGDPYQWQCERTAAALAAASGIATSTGP